MSDVIGPGNSTGVVGGTPQKTDNTGRDWGEALGIGASVIGAILSFGAGSVGTAALATGAAAANALQDAEKNKTQAGEQQRSEQGSLDRYQQKNKPISIQPSPSEYMSTPGIGSGSVLKQGSQVLPGSPSMTGDTSNLNLQGFKRTPMVEQSPISQTDTDGTTFSDRRVKKDVTPGKEDAEDFLSLVRKMNAWPKDIQDVKEKI